MPRTVCHYTDSAAFGGAEQMLARLAGSLDGRLWRPIVLHHGAQGLRPMLDALSLSDVEARAVPPLPDGAEGARALPRFVRELRALRPAVFHAHLTWPFGCKFALAGAIAARVPAIVATQHCFFRHAIDHLDAPAATIDRPWRGSVHRRLTVRRRVARGDVPGTAGQDRGGAELGRPVRVRRSAEPLAPRGAQPEWAAARGSPHRANDGGEGPRRSPARPDQAPAGPARARR